MTIAEHDHSSIEALFETLYNFLLQTPDGSPLSEFLTHFSYDLLRTGLVFIVVLFAVSYCKTYISSDHIRTALLRVNRIAAIGIACLAGLVSSTCVCTNVPLFLGFLALGVPLHLSMTYLISSSLINIASLLSMAAITGWRFTLAYTVTSVVITIVAGCLLGALSGGEYVKIDQSPIKTATKTTSYRQTDRLKIAGHELWHASREQWLWILLGILLAAVIESLVDVQFAQSVSSLGFLGVLLTTLAGLVLHTDIIAIVPVLSSFLQLHISYGILFSLTASLSFFSIPMVLMLKNTVKLRYMMYSWAIMFVLILIAGSVLLPFAE